MATVTGVGTPGILLFGGVKQTPDSSTWSITMLDDLWFLTMDSMQTFANWTRYHPLPDDTYGSPQPRGGQVMVVAGKYLWMYGGANGIPANIVQVTFLKDLWRLDLNASEHRWEARKNFTGLNGQSCYSAGINHVAMAYYDILVVLMSCSDSSEMQVWSYRIDANDWDQVWYVSGDSLPPAFVRPITLEHGGQVYIYGGVDSHSRAYSGLWVLRYNSANSTCVQVAAPEILPSLVSQQAAAYNKPSHSIYVSGGVYAVQPAFEGFETDSVDIADPRLYVYNVTGAAWTSMQHHTAPRQRAWHTLESVGRSLFIFGGYNHSGYSLAGFDRFDLGTMRWSTFVTDDIPPPRQGHASVAVDRSLTDGEGTIYIFGGLSSSSNSAEVKALSDLWMCEVGTSNGTCVELEAENSNGPPAMFGHTIALVGEYIYVIGGASVTIQGHLATVASLRDSLWRFHLPFHRWENLSATLPSTHPLKKGCFFHSSAVGGSSIFLISADSCLSRCTINLKALYKGQVLNGHTIAYQCCATSGKNGSTEVWQMWPDSDSHIWMFVNMTLSRPSPNVLAVAQTAVMVEDQIFIHGGVCTATTTGQCSNAYPSYSFSPRL